MNFRVGQSIALRGMPGGWAAAKSDRPQHVFRAAVLAALAASAAWGHVVSLSSGYLTVNGARAHYELQMPLYEIVHVAQPERALLEHVHFMGVRLVAQTCAADQARNLYVCRADYDFAEAPQQVEVECTLASVTVPNHVHVLRAEMGAKRDEELFDLSFTRATLRFRPPTAAEIALEQGAGGFRRALGGPVQILFLAALALAARSRRELMALAAMFVAGQAAAVLLAPHTGWQPTPRFVEAAAALTVAYLAVEILLLPKAGSRWLIAGALGVFHGLYFHLFLQTAGYQAGYVLVGAAVAEIAVVAGLALVWARVIEWGRALRPLEVSASALLAFGIVWFVLRMIG
jgi:hypothetical protein